MKTIVRAFVGLVFTLIVAGCVTTPADRIKKEPGVFATFPPDVQETVRKGEVHIGFTRDMVRLALGFPNRIHTRTTEAGQVEVWIYTGIRYVSCYEPMNTGYWYRDRAGRLRHSYSSVWIDRGYTQEFPVLRLELAGGVVKAIERMQR